VGGLMEIIIFWLVCVELVYWIGRYGGLHGIYSTS